MTRAASRKTVRVALIHPAGVMHHLHRLRNRVIDLLRPRLTFIADMIDYRERFPCLALLTVAGLLPREWKLDYIDEEVYGPEASFPRLEQGNYDLVLVSLMNHQARRGREIGDFCRQLGIPAVCGGYYPSALPEKMTRHFASVVCGEAEDTVPRLLDDWRSGRLQPIYRSAGNNPASSFPLPRYDLIEDWSPYVNVPLQATRGCPNDCSFCTISRLFGRKFRCKEPERLRAEVQAIQALAPRKTLYFCDENLLLDPAWGEALAGALRPLRAGYECYCDLSVGRHPELLRRLRESGCRQMQIGLESLDPQTLQAVSPFKAALLPEYPTLVQTIQRSGIEVIGMFIVGFDGDRWQTFVDIDRFIDENCLFNYNVEWLMPVPGTRIYEELEAEGRIVPDAWERDEGLGFVPRGLSAAEMAWGSVWLARNFHAPERVARRRRFFKQVMRDLSV